jgi:hypothetical protein
MRYGHGVGPRDALCHLHDKSRPDFVRNREDFAIRLLSRRNLAHYCEEPIRKLRVISDYDDFGDLTSADYPSVTAKITKIEREWPAKWPKPAAFMTIVRDRPCVVAIPAPLFCGAAATQRNYLPADPSRLLSRTKLSGNLCNKGVTRIPVRLAIPPRPCRPAGSHFPQGRGSSK